MEAVTAVTPAADAPDAEASADSAAVSAVPEALPAPSGDSFIPAPLDRRRWMAAADGAPPTRRRGAPATLRLCLAGVPAPADDRAEWYGSIEERAADA